MPGIIFGDNNEVLDSVTKQRIGKVVEGKVVLDKKEQPKVVVINNSSEKKEQSKAEIQKPTQENKSSISMQPTPFQVKKDSYFIIKFGVYEKDGRWVTVNDKNSYDNPDVLHVWVKFRMWTYSEELEWKGQCNEFNPENKMQWMNFDKLNELKIKKLILDWSFGQQYDRLKLLHTDGVLSDESYKIFKSLYPTIVNTIIALMNSVLEQNQ